MPIKLNQEVDANQNKTKSHLIAVDNGFIQKSNTPAESAEFSYSAKQIDLTQLIQNTNSSIVEVLNSSNINLNLLQNMLNTPATWENSTVEEQCKLLFYLYNKDFKNNKFITQCILAKDLISNITNNSELQRKFVKICIDNIKLASIFLEKNSHLLATLSKSSLIALSYLFYPAVEALFEKHTSELGLSVIDDIINSHPKNLEAMLKLLNKDSSVFDRYNLYCKIKDFVEQPASLALIEQDITTVGAELFYLANRKYEIVALKYIKMISDILLIHTTDILSEPDNTKLLLVTAYITIINLSSYIYNNEANLKSRKNSELKAALAVNPHHKYLLTQTSHEDFKLIITNFNLDIFDEASQEYMIEFIVSFNDTDTKDSSATPYFLKELSENNEKAWNLVLKNPRIFNKITQLPQYYQLPENLQHHMQSYLFKFSYLLAIHKTWLDPKILTIMPDQFKVMYAALTEILSYIDHIIVQLNNEHLENLTKPQLTLSYDKFMSLIEITGYFRELTFLRQKDSRITLHLIKEAFSALSHKKTSQAAWEMGSLEDQIKILFSDCTQADITSLLSYAKTAESAGLLNKILTLSPDCDKSSRGKYKILSNILLNKKWSNTFLSGAILIDYLKPTYRAQSLDRVNIINNAIFQHKIHAYKKLQEALEIISCSDKQSEDELNIIIELIKTCGFNAKIHQLLTEKLQRYPKLLEAVLTKILFDDSFIIATQLRIDIHTLKPITLTNIDLILSFPSIAKLFLQQHHQWISGTVLAIIVKAHGDSIINSYPALKVQLKYLDQLNQALVMLNTDNIQLECIEVPHDAEVNQTIEEFNKFIKINYNFESANENLAREMADNLAFINKKFPNSFIAVCLSNFPQETGDILQWTINCALAKIQVAQDKINQLIELETNKITELFDKILFAVQTQHYEISILETILQPGNIKKLVLDSLNKTTPNALILYFIEQYNTHKEMIDSTYLDNIDNKNKFLSFYFSHHGSSFNWPLKQNESDGYILCQLIKGNYLTLASVTELDEQQINKFSSKIVSSYLESLVSREQNISLDLLFALDTRQLEFYPLVSSKILTLNEANNYPLDTLDRALFTKFIGDANWNNNLDIARLRFIKKFVGSALFINIKTNILTPIQAEIDNLKLDTHSGIFTVNGLEKSQQLAVVHAELKEIIISNLTKLFIPEADQNSVVADPDIFGNKLKSDLYHKLHEFTYDASICHHRNAISRLLKNVLDTVTWFLKPFMSDSYRHRLFSPTTANTLYNLEAMLQAISSSRATPR